MSKDAARARTGRIPSQQLVGWLALLAGVISVLFAVHLIIKFHEQVEYSRTNTKLGSSILGDWTTSTFQAVDSVLSAAARITTTPGADVGAEFRGLLTVSSGIIDLGLYDALNHLVAGTATAGILPEVLADPGWQSPPGLPTEGAPVTGVPFTGGAGQPVIPIAVRLADGALVVGALDPAYFVTVYRSILRRPSTVVTLVDGRGVVLARSTQEGVSVGQVLPAPIDVVDSGDGSDERFVGRTDIPHAALALYLTASRQTAVMHWWRDEITFIVMFVLIQAVLFTGGLAFRRQLRNGEANRQARLKALHEAESASRAKSRFLAMMSHELRTPMAGMLGTLDLLRQSPLDRQQDHYVAVLDTSAHALLDVLNDILDFSRLESGSITVERIPFALRETMNDAVDLYRARCEQKNVRLTCSVEDDVPDYLIGDPARLRQVLTNLIANAVKFTQNGEISVRACQMGRPPARLFLSVQDTGIGMSSVTQAMLFEPFVQADASMSRRFGGTGLGLAICKRLVQAMGGEIGLTSAIGNGSRFWFTVPLARSNAPESPTAPAPEIDTTRKGAFADRPRVLVAEDNEINRFLIREQLTRRGFEVFAVENGWRAVEERRRQNFDLILLDMRMPVMDGPGALAQMREDAGEKLPPVVALTADALPSEVNNYMNVGFDRVLTKPVDWSALEKTLTGLLQAHRERSAARPAPVAAPTATGRAALPPDLQTLSARDPQFDSSQIDELRDVMDEAAIDDLVASFRTTLAGEGAKLHRFVAAGDAAQLRETAHAIQGMASQLGAHGIANVARSIRLDGPDAITGVEAENRLDLFDLVVQATLARLDALKDRGAA
ncbi:MAG: ATP-binding protein [Zavarzinia sp.]|nr:ATP-binding protein [Zavarzinia sp.]